MNRYDIKPYNLRFSVPKVESDFLDYDYGFSIWHARVGLIAGLFFSIIATVFLAYFEYIPLNTEIMILCFVANLFFLALLIFTFSHFVNAKNIDNWILVAIITIFIGAIFASLFVYYFPNVLPLGNREGTSSLILFPSFVAGIIYINTISIVRFSRILFLNLAYHITVVSIYYILLGDVIFTWPLDFQAIFIIFVSIPSLFISYSRERLGREQFIVEQKLSTAQKESDVARKESENARNESDQMLHLFTHLNITTETPNRAQLQHSLKLYLDDGAGSEVSLILMKLSRFKEINNTIGHDRCDDLLRLITLKIDSAINLSSYDVLPIGNNLQKLSCDIAVIEGITFALIFKSTNETEIRNFSSFLRDSTSGAIEFEETLLDLQMIIGISSNYSVNDRKTAQTLIHEAQVGLSIGGSHEGRIGIYSPLLDSYSEEKLSLMGKLRKAISDNELDLYYQPKVNFKSKEIYGVEALLRWKDDQGQFYNPFEIVTHAESTGVIKDLTRWIVSEAFGRVAEFKNMFPNGKISINLSTLNLREDDFVDFVLRQVVEHEITADDIVFEITENNMLDNADIAIKRLIALRACGFKISVDDYGTGYSSLCYLKGMPIQEVKIDRAFIKDITSDEADKIIVEATINMCHKLGYHVVAEGVEDQQTLDVMQELSCDLFQGFFFSKPLPFDALQSFKKGFYAKYA